MLQLAHLHHLELRQLPGHTWHVAKPAQRKLLCSWQAAGASHRTKSTPMFCTLVAGVCSTLMHAVGCATGLTITQGQQANMQ